MSVIRIGGFFLVLTGWSIVIPGGGGGFGGIWVCGQYAQLGFRPAVGGLCGVLFCGGAVDQLVGVSPASVNGGAGRWGVHRCGGGGDDGVVSVRWRRFGAVRR